MLLLFLKRSMGFRTSTTSNQKGETVSKLVVSLITAIAVMLPAVASANHQLSGRQHWARQSLLTQVKVPIIDATGSSMVGTAITQAAAEWSNASLDIDFTVTKGSCSTATNGVVCIKTAPFSGYWGFTDYNQFSCSSSGCHWRMVPVYINAVNTFTSPNDSTIYYWLALHELGHAIGLDHRFGSCTPMDYWSGCLGLLHPDVHDLEMLHLIYGHQDAASTPPTLCRKKCR